jgi:hypothetical protein
METTPTGVESDKRQFNRFMPTHDLRTGFLPALSRHGLRIFLRDNGISFRSFGKMRPHFGGNLTIGHSVGRFQGHPSGPKLLARNVLFELPLRFTQGQGSTTRRRLE